MLTRKLIKDKAIEENFIIGWRPEIEVEMCSRIVVQFAYLSEFSHKNESISFARYQAHAFKILLVGIFRFTVLRHI